MAKKYLDCRIQFADNFTAADKLVLSNCVGELIEKFKQGGTVKDYTIRETGFVRRSRSVTAGQRYPGYLILDESNAETLSKGVYPAILHVPLRVGKSEQGAALPIHAIQEASFVASSGVTAALLRDPTGTGEVVARCYPPVYIGGVIYCKEYWCAVRTDPEEIEGYVEYFGGGKRDRYIGEENMPKGVGMRLEYPGADESLSSAKWNSPSSMPMWASRYVLSISSLSLVRKDNMWQWAITVIPTEGGLN